MSILYLDRIEIVKKYTMREYTDLKSAPTVSNITIHHEIYD